MARSMTAIEKKALWMVAFCAIAMTIVREPWCRAILLISGIVNSFVWAREITSPREKE